VENGDGPMGANEPIGFPNTAYYLPVIYGMLGYKLRNWAISNLF